MFPCARASAPPIWSIAFARGKARSTLDRAGRESDRDVHRTPETVMTQNELMASQSGTAPSEREFLRHVVATLAYRGGKFLKGAPPEFAHFDTGKNHTPLLILSHIGDLLDWALRHAQGEGRWTTAELGTWDQQTARFHEALKKL